MTRKQIEALLARRDAYSREIEEIDRVINEIALSGYASATLSSGGGSKSYTRQNVSSLLSVRAFKVRQLSAVCSMLSGGGGIPGVRSVMTVRQ